MVKLKNKPPSSRLETLGTLAGGLAHEIKNPLSTIALNLDLLQEEWKEESSEKAIRLRKKLSILKKEVSRLGGILEHFLDYARPRPSHCQPQKLDLFLENALTLLIPRAAKQGVLIRSNYQHKNKVSFDAPQITEVFENLFINAIQAMPDGGELMVRTQDIEGGVLCEIIDTGQGMTPEVMEHIFDPYYSTKRGGTGLGLALIKRILEDHGGSVHADSVKGTGTQFTIFLPSEISRKGE